MKIIVYYNLGIEIAQSLEVNPDPVLELSPVLGSFKNNMPYSSLVLSMTIMISPTYLF